ncbi:MAG TPA: oxidoreductase [Solirubrobacteraceae bacterium]
MTRVAVVGPGAIGATMAAVAARAGAELVLCGRTPHDRLIVERAGASEVVPGSVLTDPAAVPWRADVVLLAVKAHQTQSAAPFLTALCGPGTTVVVLQNGVEQRALVGPFAGAATVVPAVVWIATETIGPGHVRVLEEARVLLPDEPAAHAIVALLEGAELAADFVTEAWRKLTVNAVAGLMVLAGRRSAIFRRDDVASVARALALETLAVARAEGADLPDAVADELLDWFAALPPDAGTSILADREAGRPLEWDARNGVVARLGARHGVPTPVSDVIVPLLAAASG